MSSLELVKRTLARQRFTPDEARAALDRWNAGFCDDLNTRRDFYDQQVEQHAATLSPDAAAACRRVWELSKRWFDGDQDADNDQEATALINRYGWDITAPLLDSYNTGELSPDDWIALADVLGDEF